MKIISLNFYEEYRCDFILVTNVNVVGRPEYYIDNQHTNIEPNYNKSYAGFWRIKYKTRNLQD